MDLNRKTSNSSILDLIKTKATHMEKQNRRYIKKRKKYYTKKKKEEEEEVQLLGVLVPTEEHRDADSHYVKLPPLLSHHSLPLSRSLTTTHHASHTLSLITSHW
uniref:Uncharacterized protein n=1 Tax=Nelumbo nucifera TaxID=4432 RepID=A0A822XHI3_NELNU|nr:TPA_asm: hypothetical protein HUJ06_020885 [Nelumbo nucifera]